MNSSRYFRRQQISHHFQYEHRASDSEDVFNNRHNLWTPSSRTTLHVHGQRPSHVDVRKLSDIGRPTELYSKRSSESIKKKDKIWFSVILISIILLTFQLQNVFWLYFSYDVTTMVIYLPAEYTPNVAIAICFRYVEIIDTDAIKIKYPKLNESVDMKYLTYDDISTHLSAYDIFDMTPDAKNIILSCSWRVPHQPNPVNSNNSDDCYNQMKVSKFYRRQHICYDFGPKDASDEYLITEDIDSSLLQSNIIRVFDLNQTLFKDVSIIGATVHKKSSVLRGLKSFAASATRTGFSYQTITKFNQSLSLDINSTSSFDDLSNGTAFNVSTKTGNVSNVSTEEMQSKIEMSASQIYINKFGFMFGAFFMTYLPAPYVTNCINYGLENGSSKYESQAECFDDCVWTSMFNQSVQTPMTITTTADDVNNKRKDTYKRMFISKRALENATLQRVSENARVKCEHICERPACYEQIFTTKKLLSGSTTDTDVNLIRFRLYSFQGPPFLTNFESKMSFTEFVIQFLSCFGIYLTIDFTFFITIATSVHKFFYLRS